MRARVLVLLVACGPTAESGAAAVSHEPAAPPERTDAPAVITALPGTPPARRCLPVVAAQCGCVYSCGLGTEEAAGGWKVALEHFAPHPIIATIDRWCVDGRCTEAFFGEIPCGVICAPRPAEANCRLVGDRCEAAAAPAPARAIATWPFTAWDRAEAITYNQVPYGPGVRLRVYDAANGWSATIAERKPITAAQAKRASEWVIATRGEVEVSKCAFPRHAVVLYSGEVPVGTANVCFECGDILVWPDVEPPSDDPREHRTRLTAYKKVFPQWERLFRDELGFSLTPPARP